MRWSWLVVMVFVLLSTGCKSIAEKFVRKPKEKSATVIAPEKEVEVNPRVAYERHFVFAKVWLDEFRSSVDGNSQKRQRESLEQTIRNMKILADYYPLDYADKKQLLYSYIDKLRKIYDELRELESKRLPLTRIKGKIEELRREFHLNFLPSRQPEQIWDKLNVE